MLRIPQLSHRSIGAWSLVGMATVCLMISSGCGGTSPGSNTGGSASGSDTQLLSSKGTLSGSITDTRSTRGSLDASGAGQTLPLTIDTATAVVTFEDLAGQPLLDENGRPYPPVSVDQAGAFFANGMPVGIDFVVVVDLDGDGNPDVNQVVQIPADASGEEGQLDNVVVDPLTTLVVAKLRQLLAEEGINMDELEISPTAIVARLVDAFIHLFEETGIDRTLTLEDIENLDLANLEELFEALIPPSVRAGFDTVEGNLALGRAGELEEVVRAVAEVFLRAGFPIVDGPEGIDLSFLADLSNVEVKSIDELFQRDEFMPDEGVISPDSLGPAQFDGASVDLLADGVGSLDALSGLVEAFGDTTVDSTDFFPPPHGVAPVVYVNTVIEPDRNFIGERDFDVDEEFDHMPVMNEHLLSRMARLHLEGRGITLRNLYRLLTDIEVGLGVRLTYASPMPFFEGPPAMVFETADGQGVEVDMEALFFSLSFSGLDDPDATIDQIEAQEQNLRALVREILAGTAPPSFRRLFGAFVSDRLEGVEQLFQFIRESKAHLPFSRSGPATFFVVADGDQFNPENLNPVNPATVDIVFGDDYMPMSISYNPSHTGQFFLGFTHETDEQHIVELLVRETGRPLRGPQGEPLFLNMGNDALFAQTNSMAFIDFVSDAGTFFPGVPISVANPDFNSFERHDETFDLGPAEFEEDFGPTMQLFVLATEPGTNGEPVRVDYNIADETFTYTPNGRYYLMFVEQTVDQGLFGLYDIDLNFMPSIHDLTMDRFIDIPEPIDVVPRDEPIFIDADGDGFPAEIDPNDNDPMIIPDNLFVGDFIDVDGDGFPADIDPDDNDPMIVPNLTNGAELIDADGDGFPADIDPNDNDPTIVPDTQTQPPAPQQIPLAPDGTTGLIDGGGPMPGDVILDFEPVLISPDQVIGLAIQREFFAFVFGTEVPNRNFDPAGNPFFDDVNGNSIEDEGEFTSDWRPFLFDPNDWRATDIPRYYRRASGGSITMDNVAFDSPTPQTIDGEALVPRRFLPRLNAFRFGRPNTAINLLTTFLPPEFFNGTQVINEDTEVGIFQAMAMINLVMEQVLNVEADVDIDGPGPVPTTTEVMDAHLFVVPIGDPFALIINGFEQLSRVRTAN